MIINNITDVIVHTPCRISIYNQNQVMYIIEKFSRNEEDIYSFLSSVKFQNVIYENKSSNEIAYTANSSNRIIYVLRDHTSKQQSEQSVFCKMDKQTINQMIAQTKISDLYTNYFLSVLFDINSYEKKITLHNRIPIGITRQNFMMIPNMQLYYIGPYERSKFNDKVLQNVIFNVYIKPDNYSGLLGVYKRGEHDRLKMELIKMPYISIFHVTNQQVNLLKQIREAIHEYYQYFGLDAENVKIDVYDTHNHNFWINISVSYRDIYKCEYYYHRLTETQRMFSLDKLIMYLENDAPLDNQIRRSIKFTKVKEYELNTCIEKNNTNLKLVTYTPKYKYSYHNIRNDYIIGNKLKHFKINRIITSKMSVATLCSLTVCVEINSVNYLFIIIPKTIAYIYNEFKKNKKSILKYINDYNSFEVLNEGDAQLQYILKHDLKYQINIYKLSDSNCFGQSISNIKPSSTNFFLKPIHIIILKEDAKLAQEIQVCYQTNFEVKLFVIIYSVIRGAILEYRKNPTILIKEFIKELIELEKGFNSKLPGQNNLFGQLLKSYEKEELYHNKEHIICFDNLEFIAIPGRSFLSNQLDKSNFKYLFWYTGFNFDQGWEKLGLFIGHLKKFLLKIPNKQDRMDNILLNKNEIIELTSGYLTFDPKTYLYNVFSLYDSNGKFKSIKFRLDTFIKNTTQVLGISYYYAFFHYFTYKQFTTLHIHLYRKESIIKDGQSYRNFISFGRNQNFSNEYVEYLTPLYDSLDLMYYNHHYIPLYIDLTNTFNYYPLFIDYVKEPTRQKEGKLADIIQNNVVNYINEHFGSCSSMVRKFYDPSLETGTSLSRDNFHKIVGSLVKIYNKNKLLIESHQK